MNATPPPFPEADLRAVLAAAVAAWAGRPPADDARSAGGAPRRVYVDAFAGAELQFGTGVRREPGEPTRADAAVRALDGARDGPGPRPVALFVEEDPAHLQRIYGELEDAIGGERLRATRDFASLDEGEASLVEAPFASVAAEVARFASGVDPFIWLAPATARSLPWEALERLLAIPGGTLLIRFPHADFEKQASHVGPVADLPGFARRIVEGCSSLLADPKHAWLPAWRASVREGMDVAMAGVLERFQALLAAAAGERMVKPVALRAEDGARSWCFLVTSDAAVARAIDGDVTAAVEEDLEAPIPEPAAVPESPEPEPESVPVEPDEEASVPEVLDLFPDGVVSAPSADVRHLRRDGSEIVFPTEPAPRARRAKAAPDDGFFAPDE